MSAGDLSFREMACGSHWSGVIEVSDLGSVALWNQEPVSLPTALPTGVITVYNFVFVGFQGGLAELQTSDSSTWFAAKSCHTLSFRTIVDVWLWYWRHFFRLVGSERKHRSFR